MLLPVGLDAAGMNHPTNLYRSLILPIKSSLSTSTIIWTLTEVNRISGQQQELTQEAIDVAA